MTRSRRRRIAILGTTAATMVNFRAGLIRSLVAAGHQVFALAPDYQEDTRQKIRHKGATPIDSPLNRAGLNPAKDIGALFTLARTLRSMEIDVVFSYMVKPVIYGTLAARLAGVSDRIGLLEGLGYGFTRRPNGQRFKSFIIRSIQLLLFYVSFPFLRTLILLNPDDAEELVTKYRVPVKNIKVIRGIGVPLSSFPYAPAPLNPIRFLFVGRMLYDKGIREYIEAAKIIKKEHPDVIFTVLGALDSGNPSALSAPDYRALQEAGIVEFLGYRTDIYPILKQTSVFVLPSYREGLPRSTQEALATGRAVITTDVPGCRETVMPGKNGFLVPPFSSQQLAERMMYFIDHPDAIRTMGASSHEIAVRSFSLEQANRDFLAVLDDLAEKG